jgi:hypothetical protein
VTKDKTKWSEVLEIDSAEWEIIQKISRKKVFFTLISFVSFQDLEVSLTLCFLDSPPNPKGWCRIVIFVPFLLRKGDKD